MNNDPSKPQPADFDLDETHDVRRMHAAVLREKRDPEDGNEPLSLWMVCFFGAVLFAGGIYLSLYSGGFRWDSYNIYDGSLAKKGGAQEAAAEEAPSLVEIGRRVYSQNCVACHMGTGMGTAGIYPPLVGTSWVNGSEKRLAAILMNGIQGALNVDGTTYNGLMPGWGKNLNDERLAAVMTYIRQEWGNQASEVTPEQAAAARKEFGDRPTPWSEAELLAIPEDAILEGGAPAEAAPETPAPAAPADATPETPAEG